MAGHALAKAMEFPVRILGIHPHIVFDLLAYTAGFQLFLWLRRRRGEPFTPDRRLMLAGVTVLGALLGAKLLAWASDPMHVWQARHEAQTWIEGKTIVGGLVGGLLAVEATKRRLGITRSTGDLYAIPLAVGIATGRIGCFLTGIPDRTHGTATALPWAVDFGDGIARHPTQIYEIAFLLALLLALALQSRRGFAEGHQFKLFLLAYLSWRLAIGFLQPVPTALGLSAIQWTCAATLAFYARRLPRAALRRLQSGGPSHA